MNMAFLNQFIYAMIFFKFYLFIFLYFYSYLFFFKKMKKRILFICTLEKKWHFRVYGSDWGLYACCPRQGGHDSSQAPLCMVLVTEPNSNKIVAVSLKVQSCFQVLELGPQSESLWSQRSSFWLNFVWLVSYFMICKENTHT